MARNALVTAFVPITLLFISIFRFGGIATPERPGHLLDHGRWSPVSDTVYQYMIYLEAVTLLVGLVGVLTAIIFVALSGREQDAKERP
jgi:hypothetical protein